MIFLIVANHKYGERVPVQIGTQVIDQLVRTMTKKEFQKAGEIGKQVYLGTTVSKRNTVKGLDIPECNLEGVKGKICTMRKVMIPPCRTTVVKGIANFTTHSKFLIAVAEPVAGYSEHFATAKLVLRPGKGKTDVWLRNQSVKQVTLPQWTAVGVIKGANMIPGLLALKSLQTRRGLGAHNRIHWYLCYEQYGFRQDIPS